MDWISVDDNGYLVVEGKPGWGDDPADIALLTELHDEAQASAPPNRAPTPGEIAYDEAHEAATDLWDALAVQERREYTDYAERLTTAIQARLAALDLPTPVTVNITARPRGRPRLRCVRRPCAGHVSAQRDRASDRRRDRQHTYPFSAAGHSPRSARCGAAVAAMTPDARPAGGRRINELMGPNWWRTEAILAARLRDLVAGLDSIGAFTIPYARLPRRLGAYAEEFPRWADVADQTPQALLLRPKLGASAVRGADRSRAGRGADQPGRHRRREGRG